MRKHDTQVRIRLPDDVHDRLKRMAEQERRSMNAMTLVIIEKALAEANQKKTAGQQG